MAEIRHARRDDVAPLAGTLARAFSDDPVMRWITEGAADRDAFLRDWFTFVVAHGLAQGHAYVAHEAGPGGEHVGGAVWTPPDVDLLDDAAVGALVAVMVAHLGEERAMARLGTLAAVGEAHPHDTHFYLFIAGTEPAHQGHGIGASLLGRVLDTCDAEGLPAYLESSNPRNIPFYERLGFRVINDITLGDDGPVMHGMWRDPSPD